MQQIVGMPASALWYCVTQSDAATWRGSGWDSPEVAFLLARNGFAVVAEAPEGLLVQPLPAWQLPPVAPGINAGTSLGRAYECAQLASRLLAQRTDLAVALELLHEANRWLDQLGATPVDCPATDTFAPPRTVAGWHGRPSLLSGTVARLRAAARECHAICPPHPTKPSWVQRRMNAAWRTAFRLDVLAALPCGAKADLAAIELAHAGSWPGMRYVRRVLARHALAGDVAYLDAILSNGSSLAAIAVHPRPELAADLPSGSAAGELAAALLWWGLIGAHILTPDAVRRPATTAVLATVDAIRLLSAIAHDVTGGAPLHMILGTLHHGDQT